MAKPNTVPGTFFISANSENGFRGYFDEIFRFSDFDKLYIIQGGPGTGKSTVMKQILKSGRAMGASAEEIRCSSDPESLDGVILVKNGRTVGILDGTSPHARIATVPGAYEEILNFGEFWNAAMLEEEKEALLSLYEKKKEAYRHAYALLKCLGDCHGEAQQQFRTAFQTDKAGKAARRILRRYTVTGEKKTRFIRAYTMRGEAVLPMLEKQAGHVFLLSGNQYAAELFLSVLEKEAEKKGIAFLSLASPLRMGDMDGIYFPEDKSLYLKEKLAAEPERAQKIIRMSRYTDRQQYRLCRGACKITAKAEKTLKGATLDSLKQAGEYHFALEKIYRTAMDFPLLQAAAQAFTRRLLAKLPKDSRMSP